MTLPDPVGHGHAVVIGFPLLAARRRSSGVPLISFYGGTTGARDSPKYGMHMYVCTYHHVYICIQPVAVNSFCPPPRNERSEITQISHGCALPSESFHPRAWVVATMTRLFIYLLLFFSLHPLVSFIPPVRFFRFFFSFFLFLFSCQGFRSTYGSTLPPMNHRWYSM